MSVHKILVLRGLQSSGKTVFAREWVKEAPDTRVRFNRDDIRNMFGKYWAPERENLIDQMYLAFLNEAMLNKYDIVIDNMNLNEQYIKDIKQNVGEFNDWAALSALDVRYEVEIKDFFHVPLQICIDRDAQRDNPIGEEIIRNTYNKYKDKITPWRYLN